MAEPRVVVVGHGMAGSRVVEQLRARSATIPVTVFGAEPYPAYNRVLLSNVLAGRATPEQIRLAAPAAGDDPATTVRTGVTVTRLDRSRREVRAGDGSRTRYDILVLATGSQPVVPPLPGLVRGGGRLLPGATVFRTVADCQVILAAARRARRAVVLGGGLLGLEAARGLAARGRARGGGAGGRPGRGGGRRGPGTRAAAGGRAADRDRPVGAGLRDPAGGEPGRGGRAGGGHRGGGRRHAALGHRPAGVRGGRVRPARRAGVRAGGAGLGAGGGGGRPGQRRRAARPLPRFPGW